MNKKTILTAYAAGCDWRTQHGDDKATAKAAQLEGRIKRNTERRYSTRSARAIIAGLRGEASP